MASAAAACAVHWRQGHMPQGSTAGRLRRAQAAAEPEEPKFLAFVGSGRRLDGKPAAGGEPVPVTFGAFGPRLPAPAPGARPGLRALKARVRAARADCLASTSARPCTCIYVPINCRTPARQAAWPLQAEVPGPQSLNLKNPKNSEYLLFQPCVWTASRPRAASPCR